MRQKRAGVIWHPNILCNFPNASMSFLDNVIIKAHTQTADQHDTVTHWTRAKWAKWAMAVNENIRRVKKALCVAHKLFLVRKLSNAFNADMQQRKFIEKKKLNWTQRWLLFFSPPHAHPPPFYLWMGNLEQKTRLAHHKHSFWLLCDAVVSSSCESCVSGFKVHLSSMPKKASVST